LEGENMEIKENIIYAAVVEMREILMQEINGLNEALKSADADLIVSISLKINSEECEVSLSYVKEKVKRRETVTVPGEAPLFDGMDHYDGTEGGDPSPMEGAVAKRGRKKKIVVKETGVEEKPEA
jgi:hypothetical protein